MSITAFSITLYLFLIIISIFHLLKCMARNKCTIIRLFTVHVPPSIASNKNLFVSSVYYCTAPIIHSVSYSIIYNISTMAPEKVILDYFIYFMLPFKYIVICLIRF